MKNNLKKTIRKVSPFFIKLLPPHIFPIPNVLIKQYLIFNIEEKKFDRVIEYCTYLSNIKNLKEKYKKTAAYFYCKAHSATDPDFSVLKNLATKKQIIAFKTKEFLLKGDLPKVYELFNNYLESIPVNKTVRQIWINILDNLIAFYNGMEVPHRSENKVGSAGDTCDTGKILVSGMLWSGSGALYDFFREFDCVSAVKNEQRLWKGKPYGLNQLSKSIGNREELKKALLHFFTVPLTGMVIPANWQETLAANLAAEYVNRDFTGEYAEAVLSLVSRLIELSGNIHITYDDFVKAAASFTDSMLNAVSGRDKPFILVDNPIHIGNIEASNLFNNTHIFCVFRDPRSNYVARYYENPRFNSDPEDFINYYRRTVDRYYDKIKTSVKNPERVIKVQFEKFILSEKYRLSLAVKSGLDLSGWSKEKYFKQNLSEKNVANYRTFFDQTIIEKIESSLKEYCVEL